MNKYSSYRLGAGRYIQEENALELLGAEVACFGDKAFVISGGKEWSIYGKQIEKSLLSAGLKWEIRIYDGQCSHTSVDYFKQDIDAGDYQVIVGIGGGRNMDLSKAIAHVTNLPVVLVPTSSATCASYTPLSVMYTDEGKSAGPWHHEKEVNVVIVDETVMANQPPRLFAAGVLDAMAKYAEIPSGKKSMSLETDGIDRYSAYVNAKLIYETLMDIGLEAYKDVEHHRLTKTVKQAVFTTIALTGMTSGLMRGIGQTALAHNLGAATHTLYPVEAEELLHGELVATGMLMQFRYNNNESEIPKLRAMMEAMHMPTSIRDFHLPNQEHAVDEIEAFIGRSQFVPKTEEALGKLSRAIKEIGV